MPLKASDIRSNPTQAGTEGVSLSLAAILQPQAANQEQTEAKPDPQKTGAHPHTYLELGVDKVASAFVSDREKRQDIDHYAGQFLTSAALFSKGKVGIAGTLVLYGLATASPETSASRQACDFAG